MIPIKVQKTENGRNLQKKWLVLTELETVANGVVLVSLLLTLNNFTPCSSASIVNFEHLIVGWDMFTIILQKLRKKTFCAVFDGSPYVFSRTQK